VLISGAEEAKAKIRFVSTIVSIHQRRDVEIAIGMSPARGYYALAALNARFRVA
jgi:hypothetical protein